MFAAYVPADRRGITTPRTVRSSSGISIVPEFDLADDPEALPFDLVILGAGAIEYSNNSNSKWNTNSNNRDTAAAAAMEYVQNHHDRGGRILTVCTGAYYVAALGLLDGSGYTTTNNNNITSYHP